MNSRYVFTHPPIGDRGGIQKMLRDLAECVGEDGEVAGSVRPVASTRRARLIERSHTFIRTMLAVRSNRPSTLVVGHVSMLETALLAPVCSSVLILVHGRELELVSGWKRRAWNALERHSVVRIAAVSEASRSVAANFGWQSQGWSILSPVLNAPGAATAPVRRCSSEKLKVVCVSRLSIGSERKNIDVLVQAVAGLAAQGAPIELCLVGDGDLGMPLRELASGLPGGDSVTFAGQVADAARDEILSRSHVFALPSTQEGFGIVALEAWHKGLAMIGSNERALADLLRHGELGLCPVPTVEAVSTAIASLLSEDTRIQLAIAGQQWLEGFGGLPNMRSQLEVAARAEPDRASSA